MYNFKTMDGNTKQLFEKAIKMCKDINIPISDDIVFKLDSAERRHGVCSFNRYTNACTISISKYLVNEDDKLNTILHELCHSCPDGHSHGYRWQYYATKIHHNYNIVITRLSKKEHEQVDVAHSRRTYFTEDEYKADGGKYLVAIGAEGDTKHTWFVKKTSSIAKNLSSYNYKGKKLIIM